MLNKFELRQINQNTNTAAPTTVKTLHFNLVEKLLVSSKSYVFSVTNISFLISVREQKAKKGMFGTFCSTSVDILPGVRAN